MHVSGLFGVLGAQLVQDASAGDPLLGLAWSDESEQAYAYFGHSVASAGDVNGDSFDDVVVGASLYDDPLLNEGKAFLYLGSDAGLAKTPAWSVVSGQEAAQLGYSVDSAGDVNGDGYADVIVSVDLFNDEEDGEGRVWVFHGSASGLDAKPSWYAEGDQLNEAFGRAVAGAGDVNGDGYDDVVVGSPQFKSGKASEGRAFVFLGSETGLATTAAWGAEGPLEYGYFGISVGAAGDVNGDGFDDFLVGAFGHGDSGKAFLYLGSASGLDSDPAWETTSDWKDADVGTSVAGAGDVDGDGYDDVLIGAPGFTDAEFYQGRADLYRGSPAGLESASAWSTTIEEESTLVGSSVAGAGDVNGDGFADVVVGAKWFDGKLVDQGAAFVFLGSATGLATTPAWSAYGEQGDAWYGSSVASAGDVNGDGAVDLLVGADHYDNGSEDGGTVFLYLGGESGPDDTGPQTDDSGTDDSGADDSGGGGEDGGGDGPGGDDGDDVSGDDDPGCGCGGRAPTGWIVIVVAALATLRRRRERWPRPGSADRHM
jgi:hypothetical protein